MDCHQAHPFVVGLFLSVHLSEQGHVLQESLQGGSRFSRIGHTHFCFKFHTFCCHTTIGLDAVEQFFHVIQSGHAFYGFVFPEHGKVTR